MAAWQQPVASQIHLVIEGRGSCILGLGDPLPIFVPVLAPTTESRQLDCSASYQHNGDRLTWHVSADSASVWLHLPAAFRGQLAIQISERSSIHLLTIFEPQSDNVRDIACSIQAAETPVEITNLRVRSLTIEKRHATAASFPPNTSFSLFGREFETAVDIRHTRVAETLRIVNNTYLAVALDDCKCHNLRIEATPSTDAVAAGSVLLQKCQIQARLFVKSALGHVLMDDVRTVTLEDLSIAAVAPGAHHVSHQSQQSTSTGVPTWHIQSGSGNVVGRSLFTTCQLLAAVGTGMLILTNSKIDNNCMLAHHSPQSSRQPGFEGEVCVFTCSLSSLDIATQNGSTVLRDVQVRTRGKITVRRSGNVSIHGLLVAHTQPAAGRDNPATLAIASQHGTITIAPGTAHQQYRVGLISNISTMVATHTGLIQLSDLHCRSALVIAHDFPNYRSRRSEEDLMVRLGSSEAAILKLETKSASVNLENVKVLKGAHIVTGLPITGHERRSPNDQNGNITATFQILDAALHVPAQYFIESRQGEADIKYENWGSNMHVSSKVLSEFGCDVEGVPTQAEAMQLTQEQERLYGAHECHNLKRTPVGGGSPLVKEESPERKIKFESLEPAGPFDVTSRAMPTIKLEQQQHMITQEPTA